MNTDTEDVLDQTLAWLTAGRSVAVATVVKTWGSAPRRAGSQLAVNDRMEFVGSVSGGCVEGATVLAAMDVIGGAPLRRLAFGVTKADAFEVGLPCGGEIELFVESVTSKRELFEELFYAKKDKRPVVVATNLKDGLQATSYPFDPPETEAKVAPSPLRPDPRMAAAAREAAERDESALLERVDGDWFLLVRNPPPRLLIIGAVHVAQALVAMALVTGFEVVVIDPREAFATHERFPTAALAHEWPEEALRRLSPDRRTAIVTLTHDAKLDDPALAFAVRSAAFYVGALGSRRSHRARLERLGERGLTPQELTRIRGPVGLDIGARSTAEIATSILAEVIRELRGGPVR